MSFFLELKAARLAVVSNAQVKKSAVTTLIAASHESIARGYSVTDGRLR